MGVYNTIDNTDTIGMTTIILIVILVILGIAVYVGQAIFLNLLNQKIKDKKTWKAWVPLVNLYLLGELTFNSNTAGYVLVAVPIIFSLIDHSVIGTFIIIGVYIYAIARYLTTLKEEHEELSPKMNISTTEKEKNPFKIKKPKLARFEKKEDNKKTEDEKEEPQQYQSQQPMNANNVKESNNVFDNRPGLNSSSSNSSSLQDLYRK